MIKNVEFKTPNDEVLQETNLARLYDDISEKIVKESEDFEGRDSGWTLDEILRLEVRTNRYSPFRGSSSFIEVPKQIAETKAIINVINKKDSQCFMWSIFAALYPNTSNTNKTSSYVPHLNKLNFDGISFPTPLNEVKNVSKMNDIGINIYSFEEDLKIFPLLISDIVCEKHIDLLYVKNGEFGHYCFIKSLSRLVSKELSKHQHKTFICKRCLSAFQTEYKLLQHKEMCIHKNPARVVMPSETREKQLNSSVGTKQLNSTGENNSTRQHERNNSTGENNSTQQQERTTQLGNRNETAQLASRNETAQLVSRNETTQLCTAVDRLQPPAPPLQQNRLFLPTVALSELFSGFSRYL
ncbi:c2H2-type domain-containing protein [Trichonephila clavipes]|nr:c2H2-type domain-containing protein [Trichonephila clavipes]